jgi:K+/H+ antiporter YhaU regulatory subunit KhtT
LVRAIDHKIHYITTQYHITTRNGQKNAPCIRFANRRKEEYNNEQQQEVPQEQKE